MKKELIKYFIDWESDTFGFGYGTGEEFTLKVLKDFFNNLENKRSYDYQLMEKRLGKTSFWLLLNILGRADIIDYGTSPRYGWLSEKGERLRDFLEDKSVDELYDLVMEVDEGYGYCGRNYCNCDGAKDGKCKDNPFF